MNTVAPLNADQQDALQELLNISMGQAANSLAHLIETKIGISIPKIASVTPEQLFSIIGDESGAHYTRQSFLGDVQGEVMSVIDGYGRTDQGVNPMPEFGDDLHSRMLLVDTGDGVLTPTPERLAALTDYLRSLQQ